MKKPGASKGQSASQLISQRIAQLGDWRGETLSRMRQLIKQADPDVVEEWKWVKLKNPGTPVWSHDGIICTGESYKNAVKLTFAKGASLKDPARLFNSSLEGNVRRAIDIHEGRRSTRPLSRRWFAKRSRSTVLASASVPCHVPRPASFLPPGRGGRTRSRRAGSPSRNSGSAPPRPSLRRGPGHRSPRNRAPRSACASSRGAPAR